MWAPLGCAWRHDSHHMQFVYPSWLAPNLLTFLGWLFCLSNPLLLMFYDWDLKSADREAQAWHCIDQ